MPNTADGLIRPAGTAVSITLHLDGRLSILECGGFLRRCRWHGAVSSRTVSASAVRSISGLRDCFEFLTRNGRGAKASCFIFCGRYSPAFRCCECGLPRKTMPSHSTAADTGALAGFDGIDLCAPGGDAPPNLLLTCDQPGEGNLAGHSGGDLDYSNNQFLGVSASVPLVAGIAALVLSAAPDLTWSEVLDTLCTTAVQIDLMNTNSIGHWVDNDGDGNLDYSRWYGSGRVDAKAAVDAAATLASACVQRSAPPEPARVGGDAAVTAHGQMIARANRMSERFEAAWTDFTTWGPRMQPRRPWLPARWRRRAQLVTPSRVGSGRLDCKPTAEAATAVAGEHVCRDSR